MLGTIALSIAVWAVVALVCVCVGSTGEVGWPAPAILPYRRELVLFASLVGAALAAAGVAYQAILRNPLADPYLLGVSSGAMLFSYLWQFSFLTTWLALGQQAFAFVGALAAVAIVFVLALRRGRLEPVTLLLVGVIVNAVNGAIFLLLNALIKDPATPGGPLAFLVGGLQTNLRLGHATVVSSAIIIAIGLVILLALAGNLNVAILSEAEAQALGVRIHRLRWIALITASLITASAVAISGPIGFIGLICPHLGRLIVGNDQRRLLPIATALGAALLAVADAITRLLSRESSMNTTLPVGVLTGLLGGPFFLLLLYQARRRLAVAEGVA